MESPRGFPGKAAWGSTAGEQASLGLLHVSPVISGTHEALQRHRGAGVLVCARCSFVSSGFVVLKIEGAQRLPDGMYKTCTVLCGPLKEISGGILTVSHYVTPLTNSVEDVIAPSRTCSTPVSECSEGQCAGYVGTAPFIIQHLPCVRTGLRTRGRTWPGPEELRAQPRRRRPVREHRPAVLLRINLAAEGAPR